MEDLDGGVPVGGAEDLGDRADVRSRDVLGLPGGVAPGGVGGGPASAGQAGDGRVPG